VRGNDDRRRSTLEAAIAIRNDQLRLCSRERTSRAEILIASRTIKEILAGLVNVGSPVIVEGWLRTRRDSKAGLSFLHVHDGSSFDPMQVVAEASQPNYQNEILHLTAHRAFRVAGTLTESLGKGQRFELKADRVVVISWVENPDTYPVFQATYNGAPAIRGSPAPPDQHVRRGRAGSRLPRDGRPSVLPRSRLCLGAHSDHHDQ
jgi:hypothetical protein